MPGATVIVTNVAMGTSVTAVTNRDRLLPGVLSDSRHLPHHRRVVGLQEARARRRRGAVGDRLALELALEVGGAEEVVTVTAEAPLLETTNASLGQVVDARRVAELPTPHGDPYALIGLAAGTSFMRSARLDRPFEPTHIVGYAMNGTRSNRSDVTIDGLPEHLHGERRRGHRVVRAAAGPRAGIQGPDGHVRREPSATPKGA